MTKWTDEQVARLLKLVEEASKPLYLFMDNNDVILASEWLEDDQAAMAYARSLAEPTVYILKAIGIADQVDEDYWIYEEPA